MSNAEDTEQDREAETEVSDPILDFIGYVGPPIEPALVPIDSDVVRLRRKSTRAPQPCRTAKTKTST